MRQRRSFGIRWALAFLALANTVSVDARASHPSIRVEVNAKAAGPDGRFERKLRALLSREIEQLTLDRARRGESYVLSAAIVRLDARASADASRATCVVSATLRRAENGVLLAMMQGRGVAEDDREAVDGAKDRALEAAVHGAVRRVPEVL